MAPWPRVPPGAARAAVVGRGLRRCVGVRAAAAGSVGRFSSASPPPPVWPGLGAWRASPQDERWGWPSPCVSPVASPSISGAVEEALSGASLPWPSLLHAGVAVLSSDDITEKMVTTHAAFRAYLRGDLPVGVEASGNAGVEASRGAGELPVPPLRPRFPAGLSLVEAREMPSPKRLPLVPFSAFTMHSMAHIELSAIHLAWDTLVRFAPLRPPEPFFLDFARAADEEARHLGWAAERLRELGHPYGSLPAHLALERGRNDSALSLAARLAVGPCAQEARGLDAGPRLASRLRGHGDRVSAAIVQRIGEEELAHVAIGVFWLRACCEGSERGGAGAGKGERGGGGGGRAGEGERRERAERGEEEGSAPNASNEVGAASAPRERASAPGAATRRAFQGAAAAIVPAILSPPFEDAARRLAGMPREWYADAAKGKRTQEAQGEGGGEEEAGGESELRDGGSPPPAPLWRTLGSLDASEEERAALARRMLDFLDAEEDAQRGGARETEG